MMLAGAGASETGYRLAESIRDQLPRLNLIVHAGGGSFKSQMRKADKSGARIALILGESELTAGSIAVKYLREDKPQIEINQTEIATQMATLI